MPPAAPAAPPHMDFADYRMQKLRALASQYEIRLDWVSRLRQLENFHITVLCDDSGSMGQLCAPGSGGGGAPRDPFGRQPTRWSELQGSVSLLVQMITALDASGAVDIYFLNRPPLLGVTDAAQVGVAFASPPQGFTPLTRNFWHIVQAKQAVLAEKRLLLLIATDGEPTDDAGVVRIPEFLHALRSKPANMYVQIMACTDDESTMSYLNSADNSIPHLDVTDGAWRLRGGAATRHSLCSNLARRTRAPLAPPPSADYASERAEVLRAQGASFRFSHGDYVVKSLLCVGRWRPGRLHSHVRFSSLPATTPPCLTPPSLPHTHYIYLTTRSGPVDAYFDTLDGSSGGGGGGGGGDCCAIA